MHIGATRRNASSRIEGPFFAAFFVAPESAQYRSRLALDSRLSRAKEFREGDREKERGGKERGRETEIEREREPRVRKS